MHHVRVLKSSHLSVEPWKFSTEKTILQAGQSWRSESSRVGTSVDIWIISKPIPWSWKTFHCELGSGVCASDLASAKRSLHYWCVNISWTWRRGHLFNGINGMKRLPFCQIPITDIFDGKCTYWSFWLICFSKSTMEIVLRNENNRNSSHPIRRITADNIKYERTECRQELDARAPKW